MRLVVLGASGGVGRHLVARGVQAGHAVTVYARPSTTIDAGSRCVRVVRGDLADARALAGALEGADAVLSSVGMQRRDPRNPWSSSTSPADLCEGAARCIVAAMRATGVRRVVAVSAAGVADSAPRLNLVMRFFLATTMIGAAYRDLARMEAVFAESGLDWLAPRPTRLTAGIAGADVRVVEAFGAMDAIAREDVARWMLDALLDPAWPAPSWGGRTPQITAAR
jgi:putative NADH-flavin reductase